MKNLFQQSWKISKTKTLIQRLGKRERIKKKHKRKCIYFVLYLGSGARNNCTWGSIMNQYWWVWLWSGSSLIKDERSPFDWTGELSQEKHWALEIAWGFIPMKGRLERLKKINKESPLCILWSQYCHPLFFFLKWGNYIVPSETLLVLWGKNRFKFFDRFPSISDLDFIYHPILQN